LKRVIRRRGAKGPAAGAGLVPPRVPSLRGRGRSPIPGASTAAAVPPPIGKSCAPRWAGQHEEANGGCNADAVRLCEGVDTARNVRGAPYVAVLAMVLQPQRSSRIGAAAVLLSFHVLPTTTPGGGTPRRILSPVALPGRNAVRLRGLYVWGGLGRSAPPCGC
jgi:hypothetical protein